MKNPCWDGYKAIGMKDKNGRKVPNCVPESSNNCECEEDELKMPEGWVVSRSFSETTTDMSEEEYGYWSKEYSEQTDFADDGKKYTHTYKDPKTGNTKKVRYGAKGYSIAPGTKKGDSYCARSEGDMKSEGMDCSGPDKNTPMCLSREKWRCKGAKSSK